MSKPAHAFRTPGRTWYPAGEDGVYTAEPGGGRIELSLARQQVPEALLDPALERVVQAWVIARGGRRLCLNGRAADLHPRLLERPPAGPARRLVSIAPSNAEIVAALDAADLLVGVDGGTDFPPLAASLPRLGPELAVELEALAALQPDLVLASLTVPGMERNLAGLDALGLPMLVTAPQCLADIEDDVLRVGEAIGRAAQAHAVVARMRAALAEARAAARGRTPVRVFLEWWHQPMFTPGAACWSNELIEAAGGVNVFRHLPGQSARVSPAAVVEADPELIFLSWCGVPFASLNPARVLRRPELSGVTAVREGRVYPVDEALLGRPGPRVVQGVVEMAGYIRRAAAARA